MLTIKDIQNRFNEIICAETFTRVYREHPLELFLGKDINYRETLLLVCEFKPKLIFSSSVIEVIVGKRKDRRWAISFSLTNSKYLDIFSHFCFDLISSSEQYKVRREGTLFICSRYIKWQEMLKRKKGELLSEPEIKGLIGELYFLKDNMIQKYGLEKAIKSWIGPSKADQDFVVDNTWYEIKATTSGSDSIKISSIEQLDRVEDGNLVVLYLDKTSMTDTNRITLNTLIENIHNLLIYDDELLLLFNSKLIEQGCFKSADYSDYCYRFNGIDQYLVTCNFPSLKRNEVPTSIENVNYSLLLSEIKNYKVDIKNEYK